MSRPDWDTYFLELARTVASRSTCPRALVGAVIVWGNRVLATGYNGAAPGDPHCTEVGCLLENGHCQRAIHAETNAVAQAAKFGVPINGATLYYWDSLGRSVDACTKCSQVMRAAGIARVVGRLIEEVMTKRQGRRKGELIIDLSQCSTCPQGYPWACKACLRYTMSCGGRKDGK